MPASTTNNISKINQDDINKAVWNACDTFRGVISADTYKDFILTMLFLKYLSDVYRDEYNKLVEQESKLRAGNRGAGGAGGDPR